jgi:hypothetical protein
MEPDNGKVVLGCGYLFMTALLILLFCCIIYLLPL